MSDKSGTISSSQLLDDLCFDSSLLVWAKCRLAEAAGDAPVGARDAAAPHVAPGVEQRRRTGGPAGHLPQVVTGISEAKDLAEVIVGNSFRDAEPGAFELYPSPSAPWSPMSS